MIFQTPKYTKNPFPIYFSNVTRDFGWKLWLRNPNSRVKGMKTSTKSVRSFGETTWYPCGLLTWVIGRDQKEWLIVHAWSLTWKLKTSNPEREILLETNIFSVFFWEGGGTPEILLPMHNLSKKISKWPAIFRILYGGLWQIYRLTLLVEFGSPIQDAGSWQIRCIPYKKSSNPGGDEPASSVGGVPIGFIHRAPVIPLWVPLCSTAHRTWRVFVFCVSLKRQVASPWASTKENPAQHQLSPNLPFRRSKTAKGVFEHQTLHVS